MFPVERTDPDPLASSRCTMEPPVLEPALLTPLQRGLLEPGNSVRGRSESSVKSRFLYISPEKNEHSF